RTDGGMAESQAVGMERLTRKAETRRGTGGGPAAVHWITGERMGEVRGVHPDLMRAPCDERGFDQRVSGHALDDAVARAGLPASADDRHARAVPWIAADGGAEGALAVR